MNIIQIDDTSYCVGLTWHTVPGPNIKKNASDFIKSEDMSYGVNYSLEAKELQDRNFLDQINGIKKDRVYQIGVTDDDESVKSVSLAALLASIVPSSALFSLSVGDGEKWILAISEKEIVVSTDIVISDTEARSLFSELFEQLSETHAEDNPLHVITDDFEYEAIAESHDPDYVVSINGKADILEADFYLDPDSFAKKCVVKNIDSKGGVKIMLMLIIAGGGYYGYTVWDGNKKAQQMLQEQLDRSAAKVIKTGPTDAEILEKARNEEIKWAQDDYSDYANADLISAFTRAVNETPRYYQQWSPTQIIVKPGAVQTYWKTNTSTPLAFIPYAKSIGGYTFGSKGDTAVTSAKFDVTPLSNEIIFDTVISNPDTDKIWFIDALQRSDTDWSLDESLETARREPISGLRDPRLVQERQYKFKEASFNIKGTRKYKVQSLTKLLNEANRVKIQSININLETNAWEIKGTYYEK